MTDLMSQLAAEAADLSSIPSEDNSARLRKLGMELVQVDAEVTRLEAQLEEKKKRRLELQHKEMPDLMMELRQDRMGLPDANVDIELKPYFKASIPADWEAERREAGFQHLEELGAGSIIRNTLTLSFDKGDHAKVQVVQAALASDEFIQLLESMAPQITSEQLTFEMPPVEVGMTVPWNTLTSFVKEWYSKPHGEDEPTMDLDKLGATVGYIVRIKPRKG